jgi:hypothetical protein
MTDSNNPLSAVPEILNAEVAKALLLPLSKEVGEFVGNYSGYSKLLYHP